MPRKPRSTPKETKPSSLLEAIRFVSNATAEKGPINETHLYLGGHWAAASNGAITIATKIDEDIWACPNASLIQQALSRCTESFAITQLDKQLSIKSGKFSAKIPCIEPILLTIPSPDAPIADIDDNLKSALEIVGILANENSQDIVGASLLFNGRSVVASDRTIIFECWHGIDLPTGLSLPKAIIQPLAKAGKPLKRLGWSQSSVTFYYDDESWIKTQLFSQVWPDITGLLDRPCNPLPFPRDFWEGLTAVQPFSPDGLCHFGQGHMQSHGITNVGASYEVEGLPKGPVFTIKQLTLIKPHAKTVDWFAAGMNGTYCMFFGDGIRGAIAGRSR